MNSLVRDVSFEVGAGERVGLIGESGSGKSLTALAIMGLLPEELRASGSVRVNDRELLGMSEKDLSRVRGSELAMVFQEPMTALNPAMRVGRQVTEPGRIHGRSAPRRRPAFRRGPARARLARTRTSCPAGSGSVSCSRWRWPTSRRC